MSQVDGAERHAARGDNRLLNLVRSAAALLVLLGHIRQLFVEDYADAGRRGLLQAVEYATTSLGPEAVIVFFVLSGYFVGGGVVERLRRRRFAWGDYATSRLTRLWIVLVPALVVTIGVDGFGALLFPRADPYAHPELYTGLPADPQYDPLTFLGNVVFLQSIHVPVLGTNNPLWSLAYEFWYYLLFPAVLSAVWAGRTLRQRIAGALLACIGAVVAGPDVLLLFPCWLIGALVAAFRASIRSQVLRAPTRLRVAAQIAAPAVLLGAMTAAHAMAMPSRSSDWMLSLVTGLVVALYTVDATERGRAGRAITLSSSSAHSSYSLYAIHMPIVVILAAWLVPSFDERLPLTHGTYLACLALTAAIGVVGWAFSRGTEARTELLRGAISHRVARLRRSVPR